LPRGLLRGHHWLAVLVAGNAVRLLGAFVGIKDGFAFAATGCRVGCAFGIVGDLLTARCFAKSVNLGIV
jgi:hypothetical protein